MRPESLDYFVNMPASAIHRFIYESRYSVLLCCSLYLVLSITLFTVTGLHAVDAESLGFDSKGHLLGMILLMSLLPVWLIGCMFVTQRNSLAIAHRLDKELALAVVAIPSKYIGIGILGGLSYALAFNVPIKQFNLIIAGNGPMISIFIGQILVWVFVGWMLAVRVYVGNQFYSYGKIVPITIFEQSTLEPFARVGMLDVAIVVGGMAISAVQSIDAQFRIENYLTAVVVALPAAVALLVRPMWTVHLRLVERKKMLLAEIQSEIQRMSESTDKQTMAALELLLTRRDRIHALHNWPLDFSIWSRLFFYGLIPPLAWVGAALVEVALERAISG